MSLASVETCSNLGLEAPSVIVEVHLSGGLPGLTLVGMPHSGVRESKDRVRSALLNSGYSFPPQRITINLSPADLPKDGGRFDLPIAIGILAASGQITQQALHNYVFVGELALSGELLAIQGVLAVSLACQRAGKVLVVSNSNAEEALLPSGARIIAAKNLLAVIKHLNGSVPIAFAEADTRRNTSSTATVIGALSSPHAATDMATIHGQAGPRRALEIAAAGGHSLLFHGPPGSGKTLLAHALPTLLPELTLAQQLDVAAIHSLAGQHHLRCSSQPPYRAPHHSTTGIALIGGGSGIPKPGEVSLAHHGVLFLDELPEFSRAVLETLREPLESGVAVIARIKQHITYPARFQLIAAMNPCPCGYASHSQRSGKHCQCTPEQISRYRQRISGPLLDRIDLRVAVEPVPLACLHVNATTAESSALVRARVIKARGRQLSRQTGLNAHLCGHAIIRTLEVDSHAFVQQAGTRLELSARAYHRILRVARSIADLADEPTISSAALAEALAFRGEL